MFRIPAALLLDLWLRSIFIRSKFSFIVSYKVRDYYTINPINALDVFFCCGFFLFSWCEPFKWYEIWLIFDVQTRRSNTNSVEWPRSTSATKSICLACQYKNKMQLQNETCDLTFWFNEIRQPLQSEQIEQIDAKERKNVKWIESVIMWCVHNCGKLLCSPCCTFKWFAEPVFGFCLFGWWLSCFFGCFFLRL